MISVKCNERIVWVILRSHCSIVVWREVNVTIYETKLFFFFFNFLVSYCFVIFMYQITISLLPCVAFSEISTLIHVCKCIIWAHNSCTPLCFRLSPPAPLLPVTHSLRHTVIHTATSLPLSVTLPLLQSLPCHSQAFREWQVAGKSLLHCSWHSVDTLSHFPLCSLLHYYLL